MSETTEAPDPVRVMANRLSVEHGMPLAIGYPMALMSVAIATTQRDMRMAIVLSNAFEALWMWLCEPLGVAPSQMTRWIKSCCDLVNSDGMKMFLEFAGSERGKECAARGREELEREMADVVKRQIRRAAARGAAEDAERPADE